MAKSPEAAHPTAHEAPAPREKPGEPRVIPEFRREGEGQAVFPTRLADFPAEAAAGWARWKVSAAHKGEATWSNAYVLAKEEKDAIDAYKAHFEVTPEAKVKARKMPD